MEEEKIKEIIKQYLKDNLSFNTFIHANKDGDNVTDVYLEFRAYLGSEIIHSEDVDTRY